MGYARYLRRYGDPSRLQSEIDVRRALDVAHALDGAHYSSRAKRERAYARELLRQTHRLLALQRLHCKRAHMHRCPCNVLYLANAAARSCAWCQRGGAVAQPLDSTAAAVLKRHAHARHDKSKRKPPRCAESYYREETFVHKLLVAQQRECMRAGMRMCGCLLLYRHGHRRRCLRCRSRAS